MKSFFTVIAHHAETIPKEVKGRLVITSKRLREIGEPAVDQIFNWPNIPRVEAVVHQCFPNLNRQRNNINPNTGSPYTGKTALFPLLDFHKDSIYQSGLELNDEEKEHLLKKYYDSFFQQIDKFIKGGNYDFFIDAHSMNNYASSYGPSGERPDICLGNRGDENGEKRDDRPCITFPAEKLRAIRDGLKNKGYDCLLNQPFSGGYIIQKYAQFPFPCLQFEINKKLFMSADDGEVSLEKVEQLKKDLLDVIFDLF